MNPMNRIISPGSGIVLIGIIIILIPNYIFPVCPGLLETVAGKHVPMKCFWTARAEIGAGALVVLGGCALLLFKDHGARFGVSLMTAFAGALVVAIPTVLIGVCGSPVMPCRSGTLPALVVSGCLVIAAAVATAVCARSGMRRQNELGC